MMDAQYILAMGWTLIHSFWQLTVLAMVFYLVMLLMKNYTSRFKYWTGLLFMVLSVSVTSTTFILMFQKYGTPLPSESVAAVGSANAFQVSPANVATADGFWAEIVSILQANIRSLTLMYMIGLGFLFLRMIFSFWKIRNLKTRSRSLEKKEWSFIPDLVSRMKVNIRFDLRWSEFVQSPMVIGVVRPVVLVPASMVSNTPPSIMEAVLAHELAHIQRNDFLINIFQTLIETFFFYHPAVWYFSYVVRREREYSCDQKAIEAGCTREDLAKALTWVGQIQKQNELAMAFGGRSNELLNRIRYLLGYKSAIRYAPSTSILYYGSLLGIFLLFSIGKSQFHKNSSVDKNENEKILMIDNLDTLPKNQKYKVKSRVTLSGDTTKNNTIEVEVNEDEFWRLDSFENQWGNIDSSIQFVRIDTFPDRNEAVVVRTDEEVTVIVNGDTVSVHTFPDMRKIQDSLREVHIELRKNMPELKHLDSIMIEQRIKLDSQRMKIDVQRLYHDSLQSQLQKNREFHFDFPDSMLRSRSVNFNYTFPDSLISGNVNIVKDLKFDSVFVMGDKTLSVFQGEFIPELNSADWDIDIKVDSILQSHSNWDSAAFRSAFAQSFHPLENKSQEIKELEEEIRRKEQELRKLRQERHKKFMEEMKKEKEKKEKK